MTESIVSGAATAGAPPQLTFGVTMRRSSIRSEGISRCTGLARPVRQERNAWFTASAAASIDSMRMLAPANASIPAR